MYETVLNDKKFSIQQCVRKTYVSNYLYYKFILEGAEPLEVNSLDDEHGLPYRPDVFNASSVKYFDTIISYCTIDDPEKLFAENSAYLTTANYPDSEKVSIKKYMKEEIYKNLKTERKRFLLYLDPKKYSLEEFNDLGNVMTIHIKEINELLFACKPFNSFRNAYDGWQFCGIVYGNEDDFSEVYTKSKDDFFKVFPDGRIAHYNELPMPGKNWLSSQDFIYTKIKMPGKIIQLIKYTKNDMVLYKNTKGQSITENFVIEQGFAEVKN
ncbi:MAG: hypothetical protein H0W73_01985 [Bacteroidetes bacterium]|nr:hypothetical protein [Bacteroidota bacterium]